MYLDSTTGDVTLGGRTLRLRPQTFAVLEILARRAPDFISRHELEAHLWPAAKVTRNSLDQCITLLRRDLVELPGLEVVTARSRGYALRLTRGAAVQRFVGRTREIGELDNLLATARQASSRLVMLSAEAGGGKTTLLDQWLGRQPAETLILGVEAARVHDGPESALGAIVDALETTLAGNAEVEFEVILRERAPQWHAAATGMAAGTSAAALDPARLVALLADVARQRAVVVALDDLHRASAETVDLLSRLARTRSRPGLLVIATARATETSGAAADLLLGCRTGAAGARELPLHGFDLATTSDYVRALLPEASDGLCAQVHERSSGHPFFLAALVGDLRARGGDDATLRENVLLPDSLRAWVAEQIAPLAGTDQVLLASAAVIGLEFDDALVAAILGRRRPAVAARLYELSSALHFLVTTSPGRWRIQQPLVREALRQQVPAARAAALHRAAALRLAAAYDSGDMAAAIAISGHFERAGDHVQAAAWALRAGQSAVALGAMRDAAGHLEHGLELTAEAASQTRMSTEVRALRIATLAELLGVRRALLGPNHPAVEATVDDIRRATCREGPLEHLHADLATALQSFRLGAFKAALDVTTRALAQIDVAPEIAPDEAARVLALQAESLAHLGCLDEADAAADAALARLGKIAGPGRFTLGREPGVNAWWVRAFAAALRDDRAACGQALARAAHRARRFGRLDLLTTVWTQDAWYRLVLRDLDGHDAACKELELLLEVAPSPRATGHLLALRATREAMLGRPQEAVELLNRDQRSPEAPAPATRLFMAARTIAALIAAGRDAAARTLLHTATTRIDHAGGSAFEPEFLFLRARLDAVSLRDQQQRWRSGVARAHALIEAKGLRSALASAPATEVRPARANEVVPDLRTTPSTRTSTTSSIMRR